MEKAEALNLLYIIHTGDIVGNGLKESYWERIAPAMDKLRQAAPLMTAAGNHDVGKRRNYEPYLQWRFDTLNTPPFLYQDGRGSYAPLETDVGNFLLLSMGITISEEGFQWLNEMCIRDSPGPARSPPAPLRHCPLSGSGLYPGP